MRVMLLEEAGRPLRPAERDLPVPGPREVLLRVRACGVCRTDLHVFDGELTEPRLPLVLGQEDAARLIQCTSNLKHRTVLLTLFAAGLRLSEATHLKVTDLDSQRMQLRVMHGKGAKQRLVPMSPRLLTALRNYWREYRPPTYLFPGKDHDTPLSGTTMQKAVKAAAREAGLSTAISPHTLRHSFATGLLEAGVDLLTIGQLLGHKSFMTTMIYLHVRRPHLQSTPSPIDWLPVRQCPRWLEPPEAGGAPSR